MLDLAELDNSTNRSIVIFGFNTYALQLQDIDPSFFNGQTFAVNLGSVEDAMSRNRTSDLMTSETDTEMFTASVQLPKDFLDLVAGCGTNMSHRLSYSVFLTDVLFQTSQTRSLASIGSIIVTVQLGCARNSSLLNPFRVAFRTTEQVSIG